MNLPVPGLEDIRAYWLQVEHAGNLLHGIMLYSLTDKRFPEYMKDDGFRDLDAWSRIYDLRIFLLQSPPEGWLKRAFRKNRVWSELVRARYGGSAADEIVKFGRWAKITVAGKETTVQDLFAGCSDDDDSRELIDAVLSHFQLPPTSHPCVILFKDFNGSKFWIASLKDLLNRSEGEIHKALNEWFENSPDLKNLAIG